jgi:hypothetical protein
VQRKSKAKSLDDEQKPDVRRDAFGTSGHVTAKSPIYSVDGSIDKGAFCKSGVYARKDSSAPLWPLRALGPKRLAHRVVGFQIRPANQVDAIRHGSKNARHY